MKTIFISYSRSDAKPASYIAEKLQERYDVDIFIDYLRLRAGDRFSKRLGKEIESRDYFLVLVSPRSMNSKWVDKEMHHADVFNKIIIPVILEPVDPILILQGIEHVDFQRWNVDKQVDDAILKMAISMELEEKQRKHALPDKPIESQQTGKAKSINEPAVVGESVEQQLGEAANLEAKQPAKAYVIYQRVREINPANMDSGTRGFLDKKLEKLKPAYLEDLLKKAQNSMQTGKWEQVIQLCQEILSQDKDHAHASRIIRTAQKNMDCQPLYQRAILASKAGQWPGVVTFLREVKETCPDFGHPAGPLINSPLEPDWVEFISEVASCRHRKKVASIVFSPDGQKMASLQYGEQDGGKITIWDVPEGQKITEIPGKVFFNTVLRFSPDGSRLAGISEDRLICLWDALKGEQVAAWEDRAYNFADLAFLPDGKSLVTASNYGSAKLWDMSGNELPLDIEIDIYSAVAFSQDGSLIAFDDTSNTVNIWNIPEKKKVARLQRNDWFFDDSDDEDVDESKNEIQTFKFSPAGNYLASVTYGGAITVWSIPEGKELDLYFNDDSAIQTVLFSQDEIFLVLQSEDGELRIWNLKEKRKVLTLSDSSSSIALSPNRNILACTLYRGFQLWSIPDGEELISIEGHSKYVSAIAFSPGGNLIATASHDKTIKLWGV